MSGTERVIVLVDMDCFYCQVEEKLNPELKGKPVAVVQYNQWKGGGLIAVNYEARACGVSRHMRGDDATAACPDIQLVSVPTVREKADLTRYRQAGKEVATVLQSFTSIFERASIDEAYLDITNVVCDRIASFASITAKQLPNTHVVGFDSVEQYLEEIKTDESLNDSNVRLFIGGLIVEEMREAVFDQTGYRCSAGVAHNKILAKLCAGLHKPNKQTILPHESVAKFYETISIHQIRSMGGKFGSNVMQTLNAEMMADLVKYSEKELQQHFDKKTANWLYNIARGMSDEPVTVRLVSKSIGCCKKFPGPDALDTAEEVRRWIHLLSLEIVERIDIDIAENNRKPKHLVVNYAQQINRKHVSNSRSQPLTSIDQERIELEAYEVVKSNCQRKDGSFRVTFLGLNVSKFEDIKTNTALTTFFKSLPKKTDSTTQVADSVEGECKSDNSEAELEAINNSLVESLSSTPKTSFFRQYLVQNVAKRDFNTSISLSELEQVEEDSNSQETFVEHEYSDPRSSKSTNSQNSNQSVRKTSTKKDENTRKRKKLQKARSQTTSITDFFSNYDTTNLMLDETNSEVCSECNKRIALHEIACHFDYHVAKRIHVEINASSNVNVSNQVAKKTTKSKKLNKCASIQSFFKPL